MNYCKDCVHWNSIKDTRMGKCCFIGVEEDHNIKQIFPRRSGRIVNTETLDDFGCVYFEKNAPHMGILKIGQREWQITIDGSVSEHNIEFRDPNGKCLVIICRLL